MSIFQLQHHLAVRYVQTVNGNTIDEMLITKCKYARKYACHYCFRMNRANCKAHWIFVSTAYRVLEHTSCVFAACRTGIIIGLCLLMLLMMAVLGCVYMYRKRKQAETPHSLGQRGAYPEEYHEYIGMCPYGTSCITHNLGLLLNDATLWCWCTIV